MKLFLSAVLIAGLGAGTLLMSGCKSGGGYGDSGQTHKSISVMMCPGCETVWVREPGARTKYSRISSARKMTCDSCDATAKSVLLEDGQVQLHNCPSCKVKPILVDNSPKHDHRKTK